MNEEATAFVEAQDQRRAPRREANDGAIGFIHGRNDAFVCVVKDISETGARIALVDEIHVVPKRFKLHIPDQHIMADCEYVWHRGRQVGLKFREMAKID